MLECGRGDARLFRNNTGMGWAGNATRVNPSDVLVRNARPLHAGLCTGSSDLIGWRSVLITPDMVGQTVALFTAVEAKGPTARTTTAQRKFIDAVNRAGGLAGLARSVADARNILRRDG
ncbi:VRR-NUC domain-containing protein [Kaustia mangrovi]|uniref:VRR-NUC domain-containing protein n=2 Tax=Kaustia mangrovi TaxID=2593653 RepID=A0A7S8HE15_9HYPH|nr:VRR-NUC domain-containing protein [Kaustia mangrovi]